MGSQPQEWGLVCSYSLLVIMNKQLIFVKLIEQYHKSCVYILHPVLRVFS